MSTTLFLVIWTVRVLVADPSPSGTDPYSGEPTINVHPVFHGHYEERQHTRVFTTRPDAEAFIAHAPEQIRHTMQLFEAKEAT